MKHIDKNDSLLKLLGYTSRRLHSGMHHKLHKHKIYRGQMRLLKILWHQKEGLTQKELAEKMHVTPATMSKMIKSMESGQYIVKKKCENDQRKVIIKVAEASEKIRGEVEKDVEAMEEVAFGNFTAEEKIIFRRLLMQVVENIEKHEKNLEEN